ncbi:Co2+/Mg2+ efflux protein ApaG [soil metagenome]
MQPMFYQMTEGIRITVRPSYAAEHSDPMEPRYVFVYRIRIENTSDRTAQLGWRHWFIHDAVAGDSEVEGEGVVGEQPVLAPGETHEYESFCVLRGPLGHMEGYYEFTRPDLTKFKAFVPRFLLNADGTDPAAGPNQA